MRLTIGHAAVECRRRRGRRWFRRARRGAGADPARSRRAGARGT
ncbi:hypothetical protein I552_4360 [Mycobacterium xenopi 3993]|nr:hypothetical protein I552_4360 [Mycobacterium xenopi 3993]